MWENAKIVAPTPNSAIVQPNVDDNFVINTTHLNMIRENKFNGHLRADLHDHIREFLAICNMFRYGETQSEAVKLLIFPFSLCDKAKTWFNELNEESITSWEQMRKAFINRFFPPSLFNRLLLEIRNFSQNICESLTETWNLPLLKVRISFFKFFETNSLQSLLVPLKLKTFIIKNLLPFTDGSDSIMIILDLWKNLKAMDSQIISLNEELEDMREKYNELRNGNTSKNNMNDDTPMCERHEANYIQSEDYQNQDSHDSFSHQSHHDHNDSEKSLTELNKDMINDLEDFKRCVHSMRTVHDKLFARHNDEWSKSQNVSLEQTDKTDPPPPPQAHTEQVNAVFTRSEKSDDSPKTQKDPPPPIIVNNKNRK
ncbi:reverse transcriptase domain-containing protein [Tanacetum coccineum]